MKTWLPDWNLYNFFVLSRIHGRQPQIPLFSPRFRSGFKCIVTNRKWDFLLTLTNYSETTATPKGVSLDFPESLFITLRVWLRTAKNNVINPSGTALVWGAVVKIFSSLRNSVRFYCFKRFRLRSASSNCQRRLLWCSFVLQFVSLHEITLKPTA